MDYAESTPLTRFCQEQCYNDEASSCTREEHVWEQRPTRLVWFTYCLVLVLTSFFAWQVSKVDWHHSFTSSSNALIGFNATQLIRMGAQVGNCIQKEHQTWRLLTSQMLHGGFLHFIANAGALLSVGGSLEQVFGGCLICFIYIISGLFASLATALFLPYSISVGASGSICGLFGAIWSDLFLNWNLYRGHHCGQCCSLVYSTLILLSISLLPFVNLFAHFGGLLCGFILSLVFAPTQSSACSVDNLIMRKSGAAARLFSRLISIASFLFIIFLFVAMVFMIQNQRDPYQYWYWFHYLDCMPSPFWDCALLQQHGLCTLYVETTSHLVMQLGCLGGQIVDVAEQHIDMNGTTAVLRQLCDAVCPSFCEYGGPF
jgi:membrane associated rhomboid family serine protease